MLRTRGYSHFYDTGQVIVSPVCGVGTIVGLRIRKNPAAILYYVLPDNDPVEKVVFEHEIIGHATAVERKQKRQVEVLPTL
jgi:hypothetical protein